ncbi:CPBP family intramembrane metalloprotease [Natronococcus sp. A-GB1]|uniref:CPBP family intramembrane glutamic endopeptidase n=1 Tax=Natronococcus sp. A-GB1 TaxID=3037648 RepID=UPI00241C5225|nr:CPBP family intramembrane glutamic endopeptidase [Natronococcus sp. A-GB1]MDG5761054.1 CPBP family intramembrane metalloprotease [Natronococcus sp. A-GB1]
MTDTRTRKSSARGAIALFALGMVGVLALAVYSVPLLRELPELSTVSYPTLVVLASVNSALLLVVAVALGAVTAPRLEFDSHVFAWAAGRSPNWGEIRDSLPLAAALGTGLFVLVAVLDVAFAQFTQFPAGDTPTDAEALSELYASVPMRLLYGGITEEILLRWGFMAPLAYVLWWGRNRVGDATEAPSGTIVWVAIAVSAVAFGVGHLPALASMTELTAPLIVRTVLLNALVGVVLGWLFWRRSLETAMIAHAAFHVALVAVSTVLIVVA